MLQQPASDAAHRILVVPPTARDGEVTLALLGRAGLTGLVCTDMTQLCAEIEAGVGAILLTSEALASAEIGKLAAAVTEQPSWSDLPIVLLLRGGQEAANSHGVLQSLGNVTLLERPAPTRSVISALQTAVRARDRQYQIRNHLAASEAAEAHARMLKDQLALALEGERTARSEAERVGQMKDEFLATLSHELRTPLNAIFGWAQILQMSADDPEAVREGIEVIDRNVRLQTKLIEDLLDVSRIVSGKVRLDVQSVDLSELIDNAIETVRPVADAKRLRVERVIDPSAGSVSGDPGRLQQVLWNLLTNAIKFTPKEGKIQVLLERVNSQVQLSVVDTGEGIDPKFLPHLFERFSQADASITRKHGGLGLGLSIVKNLVELHGGTICAQSAGEGQGAAFAICLPIRVTKAMQEAPPSKPTLTTSSLYGARRLAGLKVLVVDDEPDARELVHRYLMQCGATAALAASAAEAHEVLGTFRADVIISDIGMPEQDGYEFIRTVRSNGDKTPALALTAFARADDRIRSIQAGFQSHLPKPVEPAELLTIVASLTGRL
jgi:signal transduction histidine kinase/CheY-like chemotaxis protein